MALKLKSGGLIPVLTSFHGDLLNKHATFGVALMKPASATPVGTIELAIHRDAQPATDAQLATIGWDDYVAQSPAAQRVLTALTQLGLEMAQLSTVLEVEPETP